MNRRYLCFFIHFRVKDKYIRGAILYLRGTKKKKIGEDTANTFSSKPERVRAKAAFLAPEAILPSFSLSRCQELLVPGYWRGKRRNEREERSCDTFYSSRRLKFFPRNTFFCSQFIYGKRERLAFGPISRYAEGIPERKKVLITPPHRPFPLPFYCT